MAQGMTACVEMDGALVAAAIGLDKMKKRGVTRMACLARMLLFVAITASGTTPLWAQATGTTTPDCNALKNSLVPYQAEYQANGQRYLIQVFREQSGTAAVWIQFQQGSSRSTSRTVQNNGFYKETESVNSVQAANKIIVLSHIKTQAQYEGINVETFDYKTDATFKYYSRVDLANGTVPTESKSLLQYKFLREEQITIGGCPFSSVVFEGTRSFSDKEYHSYYRYMPELKLRIENSTPELAVDKITTVFERMSLPAP
jgi:hypothetical protein